MKRDDPSPFCHSKLTHSGPYAHDERLLLGNRIAGGPGRSHAPWPTTKGCRSASGALRRLTFFSRGRSRNRSGRPKQCVQRCGATVAPTFDKIAGMSRWVPHFAYPQRAECLRRVEARSHVAEMQSAAPNRSRFSKETGPGRDRTGNPCLAKAVLSQLSYRPVRARRIIRRDAMFSTVRAVPLGRPYQNRPGDRMPMTCSVSSAAPNGTGSGDGIVA
jgi:hypothetical protein